MKECIRCHAVKDESEFAKINTRNPARPFYLSGKCKICVNYLNRVTRERMKDQGKTYSVVDFYDPKPHLALTGIWKSVKNYQVVSLIPNRYIHNL